MSALIDVEETNPNAPVRLGLLMTIVKAIGPATLEAIDRAQKPLLDRIDALEKAAEQLKANPPTLIASYKGIWQPGGTKRGDVVTLDGSLWLAMADTDAKPGIGDTFRLIVKRGKDGKDLRP